MPAVPIPLVIAHRGDSAHRPENTLAAFAAALEIGAAIAEFDVHLTRDGEVVVIHDATLDRTTNGHGAVRNMTLAEIRRFSAGYPARFGSTYTGERVPTLGPEILRGHLFERGKAGDMLAGAREVGSELIMPEKRLLSDDLRDRAREAGVKVATWVVDDIEELRRLMRFELYGVGSNRPGEMLEALQSL